MVLELYDRVLEDQSTSSALRTLKDWKPRFCPFLLGYGRSCGGRKIRYIYGDDNEGAEIKLKKNTRAPQPEYM